MADVTGPARVIDGDTIEVAGERIRLHGIDATARNRQASARPVQRPRGLPLVGGLRVARPGRTMV